MIKKIGIIGLGLIGGSIAKATRAKMPMVDIVAFNRREEPLKAAIADGAIDQYTTTIDNTFGHCDVIFICTPVDQICAYIQKLLPFIDEHTLLTDVGSTKGTIFEDVKAFSDIHFIGGHPMAGSEQTSYAAAKDFLFENAFYVLAPTPSISKAQFKDFQSFVVSLGAIPVTLDPKKHDHIVAAISHVPHVIASALVNCVEQLDTPEKSMHMLAAGGFKDITRIASASPDIWNAICLENKNEILSVLQSFQKELDRFITLLNKDDLYAFFESAKNYRDGFSVVHKTGFLKVYEFKVDVVDRPGIIATVATLLSVNNINIKNIGIVNNRDFSNGVLSISFENQEDMTDSKRLLKEMNFIIYD